MPSSATERLYVGNSATIAAVILSIDKTRVVTAQKYDEVGNFFEYKKNLRLFAMRLGLLVDGTTGIG